MQHGLTLNVDKLQVHRAHQAATRSGLQHHRHLTPCTSSSDNWKQSCASLRR